MLFYSESQNLPMRLSEYFLWMAWDEDLTWSKHDKTAAQNQVQKDKAEFISGETQSQSRVDCWYYTRFWALQNHGWVNFQSVRGFISSVVVVVWFLRYNSCWFVGTSVMLHFWCESAPYFLLFRTRLLIFGWLAKVSSLRAVIVHLLNRFKTDSGDYLLPWLHNNHF